MKLKHFFTILALLSFQQLAAQTSSLSTQSFQVSNKEPLETPLSMLSSVSQDYSSLSSTMSTPIGQAGNLYTILRSSSHMLSYNEDINTVVFIHRADPTLGFYSTSKYLIDVSTDGGATWPNLNLGPVNMNNGLNEPNGQARYPQTAIYNPIGNTDPNNAKAIIMGATHDGVGCPSGNNVWDGVTVGNPPITGPNINDNSSYNILVQPNPLDTCMYRTLIPSSLVEGEHGEYWAVDWVYDGMLKYEMIRYKGVYNELVDSISWDYSLMDFTHNYDTSGIDNIAETLIDFSDDGQYGWIMVVGDGYVTDCGPTSAFNPIFSRTTDGGDTWTDFASIELANFNGWVSTFDSVALGFDHDLIVGSNGAPYLISSVGSGYGLNINSDIAGGDTIHHGLFTMDMLTEEWQVLDMGLLTNFRSDPHPTALDFSNDQRYHLSQHGDYIFITFLDAPTDTVGAYRDLRGIGYNTSSGLMTDIQEFTIGDPVWGGNAWFYTAAPEAISNGAGSYNIPGVFTDIPAGDLNPVFFHYISDISFSVADFTLTPAVSANISIPPIVGTFNSTVTGTMIELIETGSIPWVCEVRIDWGDGTISGGYSQGDTIYHWFPNIDMDYNVCLTVLNNSGSDTYCEIVSITAVLDTVAPVISIMGNNCNDTITQSYGLPLDLPMVTALDAVEGPTGVQAVNNISVDIWGAVDSLGGVFTVIYSSADGSGNESICTLYVETIDDVAPDMSITPMTGIVDCNEFSMFNYTASASDLVDGNLSYQIIVDDSAVNDTIDGAYTIYFSVTDDAGNTATDSLSVTVVGCFVAPPCTFLEPQITYIECLDTNTYTVTIDVDNVGPAGFNLSSFSGPFPGEGDYTPADLPVEIGPFSTSDSNSLTIWVSSLDTFLCDTILWVPLVYCMLPGETDGDVQRLANNQDLLKIGLGYGATGPERFDQSIDYTHKAFYPWSDNFSDGRNYGYADCDGDGEIDEMDVLAIEQNYIEDQTITITGTISGGVPLYVDLPDSNLVGGSTVTLPIVLGSSTIPVTNAYGLAFTILYDGTLIEPGTMTIDFDGSMLGSSSDIISIARVFEYDEQINVGISRINGFGVSGYGGIGYATFALIENIEGRIESVPFIFEIANLTAVNSLGADIIIDGTAEIGQVVSGYNELAEHVEITLGPNPSSDFIHLENKLSKNLKFSLVNSKGQIVKQQEITATSEFIDIEIIPDGIYIALIEDGENRFSERILIQK